MPDTDGIEVDAVVRSNVMGQSWLYKLTKIRPSFRATNPETLDVCAASLTT